MASPHLSVLRRVDLFSGVDDGTIEQLFGLGAVTEARRGEYIVRQGEFGDSCFVLLDGQAEVQVVGDDGRSQPVARLRPGQYFGELALIGRGERKASVQSSTDTALLQFRKVHFDQALRKHKKVRSRLEQIYNRAAVDTFIRHSRYFRDLPKSSVDQIVRTSKLESHSKGDVIAPEGKPAAYLYIVRSGFVRISRTVEQGTDEILAYLGPEDFFGDEEAGAGGTYGASATALEPVECVAVPRSTVWRLYTEHPQVFSSFRRYSLARSQKQGGVLSSQTSVAFVRDILEAGLGQARSALIINLDTCVRCGNCVQACDDLHGYSRLARRGQKMTRRRDPDRKSHEDLYFPTSCLQCATPECMVGCPTGAIARDVGGEVYIKDTCIGCGSCARNCEFGNISMAEAKPDAVNLVDMVLGRSNSAKEAPSPEVNKKSKTDLIAVKCDVCFERDRAACVYNCPVEAILRVDPRQYFRELREIAPKVAVDPSGLAPAKTTTGRRRGAVGPVLLQGFTLIAGVGVAAALYRQFTPTPWSGPGMIAGVVAAFMMLMLATMGIRKRLRTSRLGSLARWARIHAVLGGALYGVVLFHSGFQATSVLTATLMAMLTLSVGVGLVGQMASLIVPRLLARSESEALLPEDVAPKVRKLMDAAEELLEGVDAQRADRLRVYAQRMVQSGWSYVRRGVSPKDLPTALEKRAKKLPPLSQTDHAIAIRIAEYLAEVRMLGVRRGLEILLTAWLPLHLVASAVAMMLLLGHLMTVVLW